MKLSIIVLLLFLFSCTMPTAKRGPVEASLSPRVQEKVTLARASMSEGMNRKAMGILNSLKDEELTAIELATKYNLIGVIYFSLGQLDQSLENFDFAASKVPRGTQLESQIYLNLASIFYKKNDLALVDKTLQKMEYRFLRDSELKKYAQLLYTIAEKKQDNLEVCRAITILNGPGVSLAKVQLSNLKAKLKSSYKELNDSQKNNLLEEFQSGRWTTIAYLAQIEAEVRFAKGDISGTKDVLGWLDDYFSEDKDVIDFVADFKLRLDNSSKLSWEGVGLVLPLTGDKGNYGKKALFGIETALKHLGKDSELKIYTRDSLDSPIVGAQMVRELILDKKVPFIIGGLFSESAKAEYLEAKKYGVMFISLSPVYLPREEKNHLLIEIQPSIESQVLNVLDNSITDKFGKNLALVYPEGEAGRVYLEEFWRIAEQKDLNIKAVASYPKDTYDYRGTIQRLLGLKFPRERQEEFDILESVYKEEKSSIRRIQTLPPVINFDWVFLASYPQESISLIPTFDYYDARDLVLWGGPSWASRSLVKERSLGKLYFIGENPKDINRQFVRYFQRTFSRSPGLLETLSYEALQVGFAYAGGFNASNRRVLDEQVRELGTIKGMTNNWVFYDGLWIKTMNSLMISRGKVSKVDLRSLE